MPHVETDSRHRIGGGPWIRGGDYTKWSGRLQCCEFIATSLVQRAPEIHGKSPASGVELQYRIGIR